MTDLAIGRLSATIHAVPGIDDQRSRVDRMLGSLARHRLDDCVARLGLPEGEWCLRRVDVVVGFDADDHEATIESAWADAVVASFRRRLDTSSSEVVHYRRRQDALDDLVTAVASGRTERAWAWRQMGILAAIDPSPVTDPAGAMLAAIARWPEHAIHAVVVASRTAGVGVLHRLLGADGWVRLAEEVGTAAGIPVSEMTMLLTTKPTMRSTSPDGGDAANVVRARRALAESTLAGALRRSGLRPSPPVASSWAVLSVAEADPAVLRMKAAHDIVAVMARGLGDEGRTVVGLLRSSQPSSPRGLLPAGGPGGACPGTPGRTGRATPVVGNEAALGTEPRDRTAPEASDSASPGRVTAGRRLQSGQLPTATQSEAAGIDEAETPGGVSTVWGGLLFLLVTAESAGVPDVVLEDPRLRSRTIRWVMHQLAIVLVPVAGDDAAALAFAGLPPHADPPSGVPASAPETAAIAEAALRWGTATAQRLCRPDADPPEVVSQVACRRGEIVAERGWIEMHFDLADVDVDIRRAGLDLDPGWVPWLGVVVRFLYG